MKDIEAAILWNYLREISPHIGLAEDKMGRNVTADDLATGYPYPLAVINKGIEEIFINYGIQNESIGNLILSVHEKLKETV